MKWLNIFKKNKPAGISDAFPLHVENAIKLLAELDGSASGDMVLKLFRKSGMTEKEARDIFIFLPIAFVRLWLPNLEWHDYYYERSYDGTDSERKYQDNESFVIIEEKAGDYYRNQPDNNTIVKISGRSAELNAINELLFNGGRLEDIALTPNIIFR